jgi:hypothetical protein
LETVIDGETGVFFHQQTVAALMDAVKKFESMQFDSEKIKARAREFSPQVFEMRIRDVVNCAILAKKGSSIR